MQNRCLASTGEMKHVDALIADKSCVHADVWTHPTCKIDDKLPQEMGNVSMLCLLSLGKDF